MPAPPMSVDELRAQVASGAIDTVVLAIVDLQGRLQGKRIDAAYFLNDVLPHGTEGCNYLLAVDIEMNTVEGYQISSWERGYGDFVMAPDVASLRAVPWQPGTAMLIGDVQWLDGTPVVESPRQILKRQVDRLAERGWTPMVGTELEFILFDDTYEAAWQKHYTGLTPSNQYNVDYSILGTSRVEPLLRAIRLGMRDAGMQVESAKGECNLGQHEIAFKYTDALRTCDNHTIYKTGAKEIAAQHGSALTFMAKYDQREGNSCHIHLSLRTEDGEPVFAGDRPGGVSPVFEQFLAGQLAALRELSYFFAPNINSYKRYQAGSFAPTAVAWGLDNRTCALRVIGHGASLRFENRLPGGDVNPYLAVAAMIAAGLHGIENELPLQDAFAGNAYVSDAPRVPTTLREAAELLGGSDLARKSLGDEVVDHYANTARVELAAFDAAVTDWERVRGFERM
ncbi:MAG: glutamine synthetase [Pseudonocardiales bacterium]|nr:glutamine synthetase [Pseudonocardiales bacterium]MDT4944507.1 glutamine synthetase [Pseudonocardiales bacterium]